MTLVPGTEKMMHGLFTKKFTCFKKADIPRKVIELDETAQLPNNSVLHLLDNIEDFTAHADVPKVFQNPLVINEVFKRYIAHNTGVPTQKGSLFEVRERYRMVTAGLRKELEELKKKRSFIMPVLNMEGTVKKSNVLLVMNHNPLWRIKVIGKLQEYRRFEIILRSILDQVMTISAHDKHQFIHVPMPENLYTRADIYRAATVKIDTSTLKHMDDLSYFFLIHFFAFLYKKSNISLFDLLPTDILPYVNIIFTVKDKAVIYNLQSIQSIVDGKEAIANIVMQHLNILKMSVNDDVVDLRSMEPDAFEEALATKIKEKKKAETVKIDMTPDAGIIDAPSTVVQEPPEAVELELPEAPKFEEEIDLKVESFIEEQTDLTPKQKIRLNKISALYRDIKIGNRTIQEILDTPVDETITTEELDFLKDSLPDKSMARSSIIDMDKIYMEKLFRKDMVHVITSLAPHGMFLIDYEEKDDINQLNSIKHIRLRFADEKGQTHTVKFKLPIVDEDGIFVINGIKNRMKKQQVNVPICKISATRVSLASNYNKTLVERNTTQAHSFRPFIENFINKKANKDDTVVDVKYGSNTYTTRLPYEYTTLGSRFDSMSFGNYKLTFRFDNRFDSLVAKKIADKLADLENKHGVYIGSITGKGGLAIFMGMDNRIRIVDTVSAETVDDTSITQMLFDVTGIEAPMVSEWTDLKILDKNLPVIFVLGYQYGLTNILKYLNISYRLVDKGTRVEKSATELAIKFADKTLIFDRYPLSKSLILAGLLRFTTKDFLYEEFDKDDVYYELLIAKNLSTNYLKGITDMFDLFVDPITRDVLIQMGEPTNFRDLLIRATIMLTNEHHIDPASMANHRLRSYERFNSVLYNEMSRQFAQYRNTKVRDQKFSINPEAVLQRIIQDQAVVLVNEINPIHDIKEKTGFTYTGMGGRTAQSFVVADRKYPDDAVGIISEATPDSGKVAISAFATMDPSIKNLRGMHSTTIPNKVMGFPENEHKALQARLDKGEPIYTTRVYREFGKYKTGDVVSTDLGTNLKIEKQEAIKDITKHPFYKDLTKAQIAELGDGPYDVIKLVPIKLEPTEVLSISSILMPGVTNDD